MRYIIGLGLVIVGGVTTAVTGIMPFAIIMFIGVFLFASFTSEAMFFDYRISDSDEAIIRKRYYIDFLPLTIVSYILTLGRAILKIVWKEEYFRAPLNIQNAEDLTKLSRKEYIALRNEQRAIYSTQTLSKEFMQSTYTQASIGAKRKKTRLIIASVLAAIMLTMIATPGGIYITLIYEAVFIPMIILWIPEYKDAKILQQAYDKAVN